MSTRELPVLSAPAPVQLSHAVLRTAHLDEAIEWYGLVLGARATYRADSGASLTTDGEHHRLALIAVPDEAAAPGPGLEHLAFKLESLGHLLATYERLHDAGIDPLISMNHAGTVSLYYADPDGVQIELFIDAMIAEASIDFMASDEFAANPIGSPFDPQELAGRYRSGESIQSLVTPAPFDPSMLEAFFAVGGGFEAVAGSIEPS